jgi:hypothetical protein
MDNKDKSLCFGSDLCCIQGMCEEDIVDQIIKCPFCEFWFPAKWAVDETDDDPQMSICQVHDHFPEPELDNGRD